MISFQLLLGDGEKRSTLVVVSKTNNKSGANGMFPKPDARLYGRRILQEDGMSPVDDDDEVGYVIDDEEVGYIFSVVFRLLNILPALRQRNVFI